MVNSLTELIGWFNSGTLNSIDYLCYRYVLIFFLVTTTISMDQGLNIILPSEGEEMKVKDDNISVISINETGKVLFNGQVIKEISLNQNNISQLKGLVEQEMARNSKMIFSIQVTPKTKYDDYIKVLDYVKQAKATKISIAD